MVAGQQSAAEGLPLRGDPRRETRAAAAAVARCNRCAADESRRVGARLPDRAATQGARAAGRERAQVIHDAFEANFDGLVGPTHNYSGIASGNLASAANRMQASNPRLAALQGLDKMKALCELGFA